MKQRRIFAQLVNQWQEEVKEDFKAQKRRLGMQKSGLQRTILGYSAQRKTKKSREKRRRRLQRTKVGCSAPKPAQLQKCALQRTRGAAAHPKRAQRLDTRCSVPNGRCSVPKRARNVCYALQRAQMRCSASQPPANKIPLQKMRAAARFHVGCSAQLNP